MNIDRLQWATMLTLITHEGFTLEASHIRQLMEPRMWQKLNSPENFWVLLQTGDETLDYRQALQKYQGAKLTVEEGGDHSFHILNDSCQIFLGFYCKD